MTISTYSVTIPRFLHLLHGLQGIVAKARAHAEARGFDPDRLSELRPVPDLYGFGQQVEQAIRYALAGTCRTAGVDMPAYEAKSPGLHGLQQALAEAIAFIEAFGPDRIDGNDDREVLVPFPEGERRFTVAGYLTDFCLPSLYFHAALAYAMLRQVGVPLVKDDYIGSPGLAVAT